MHSDAPAIQMTSRAQLETRLAALQAQYKTLKSAADTLKLLCNGTFGKLGSPYSAIYSPDLMLAVTLTGQLNLMSLIYDVEFNPEIKVLSANTDGIMIKYPARLRDKVLNRIAANAKRTGFEYEETPYKRVSLANVNNYVAVTAGRLAAIISPSGEITETPYKADKAKRKGLFAEAGLMKNPTFQVCSNLVCDYLVKGVHPKDAIRNYTDIKDFVSIRNVKGGGVQYDHFKEVDDWVLTKDVGTKDNEWRRESWIDERSPVKRKSRPKPVMVGVGGTKFGRIARWYMQKDSTKTINYVESGNLVPKTEGGQLCMTLPDKLPDDLDYEWYVNEAISMLGDLGVKIDALDVATT